jgi:hypothetical protein
MGALGILFQNLVQGGIDKVAKLGTDVLTIAGTFGSGAVTAIKTFISG